MQFPNENQTRDEGQADCKAKIEQLEMEKRLLGEEVDNCEGYIAWQKDEIKRLSFHLESLSWDLNKREQQLKTKNVVAQALDENKDDFASLRNRISDLNEENQALRTKLSQKEANDEKVKELVETLTDKYSASLKKLSQLEMLGEKEQKIEELENEKRNLLEELERCEDYITNQVDEMKKLSYHIERLADSLQDQKKAKGKKACTCKRVVHLKAKLSKCKTKLSMKEESSRLLKQQIQNEREAKKKLEEAFSQTMRIYEDLLIENRYMEMLKGECDMYRAQCEELKEFQKKAQRVDGLEKERTRYIDTIKECRCHIDEQEDRINNLVCDLKRVSQQEEELKSDLSKREEKLGNLQNEKVCMCGRIQELEHQIEDYESTLSFKEENNKALLDSLDHEKNASAKLKAALEKITTSHESLRGMLTKARHTINTITQKLEEYDIERLESQRDNQMKLSELEGQLEVANSTMGKLRESLNQMKKVMDENVTLKTLSSQLYDAANLQVSEVEDVNEDLCQKNQKLKEMYDYLKEVLYEKDKTFDELRNQLLGLRQQLGNEQKLREHTADVAAAGDMEVNRLQRFINLQKKEIEEKSSKIEKLMKSTTAGKLKTQVEKLEKENSFLGEEMKKLTSHLEAVLPGYIDPEELEKLKTQLHELTYQVNKQKEDIENQKKSRIAMVAQLKSKICEDSKTIKELMTENIELRSKKRRVPDQKTVILLEKEKKKDGGVEYRYLGGAKEEKKKPKMEEKPLGIITPDVFRTFSSEEDPEKLKQQLKKEMEVIKELAEKLRDNANEISDLKEELTKERKRGKLTTEEARDPAVREIIKQNLSQHLKNAEDIASERLKSKPKENGIKTEPSKDSVVVLKDVNAQEDKTSAQIAEDPKESSKVTDETPARILSIAEDPKETTESSKVTDETPAQILSTAEDPKQTKKSSKVADLESELGKMREENEGLKAIIVDLRSQLQSKSHSLTDISKPEMEKVLSPIKESFEEEQKRVAELEKLWRTCENKSDRLKTRIGDLVQENKRLKEQLKQGKPPSVVKEKAKPPSVAKEKAKPPSADERKSGVKDDVKEKSIEDLEKQLGQCQKQNSELKQKISDLVKAPDEMKQDVKPKEEEKVCEECFKELQQKLRDYERKNNNLQNELDRIRGQRLSRMSVETMSKLSEADRIKALGDEGGRIKELEREIDDLKKDRIRQAEKENEYFKEAAVAPTIAKGEDKDNLMKDLKSFEEDLKEAAVDPTVAKDEEKDHLMKDLRSFEDDLKEAPVDPAVAKDEEKDNPMEDLKTLLNKFQKLYDKDPEQLTGKLSSPSVQGVRDCERHAEIIKELELNLDGYQMYNNALEKTNAQLESENDGLKKTLKDYNEKLGLASPEDADETMANLVEHLRTLEKTNETLKHRILQLEQENGKLNNDLQRLTGDAHKSFENEMQKLRDLEKQMAKCQTLQKALKKRLIKLEIENKNLKQEYIDILITKEKLILQSHDQTKRLRETNLLLKKIQDKRHDLNTKVTRLQIDNENLKREVDSTIGKELQKHIENVQGNEELTARNDALELEISRLRELLADNEIEDPEKGADQATDAAQLEKRTRSGILTAQVIQLQMENEAMKKQCEKTKKVDSATTLTSEAADEQLADDLMKPEPEHDAKMRVVELEIENEHLKGELENKEKQNREFSSQEKRIHELEEQVQNLIVDNQNLKRAGVDLEADNEYMKKEMGRLEKVQDNLQIEVPEDIEKQNFNNKMKIENLKIEIKKLKLRIENMGKEQVSLQAHAQQKLMKEIDKLVHEYKDMIEGSKGRPSRSSDTLRSADDEERLNEWRKQNEPELLKMKQDLDKIIDNEDRKLEGELNYCKKIVEKMEEENKNMKVALDILIKEKGVVENVKLVNEVEQLLVKYQDSEEQKKLIRGFEKKINQLEEQLSGCLEVNQMFRNEKLSLESHMQDVKIKELMDEIRQMQSSQSNLPKGKLPSTIDFELSRVKELQKQVEFLEKAKDGLKADLEQLRMDKGLMQKEFEAQLTSCQGRNDDLKKENDRYVKLNDLLQIKVQDLENRLKQTQTVGKPADKKVTFEEEAKKLQKCIKEKEKLTHGYLKLFKQNENSEQMLEKLEEDLKKCRDANKDLRERMSKLIGEQKSTKNDQDVSEGSNTKEDEDKKRENKDSGPNDAEEKITELEQQLQLSLTDNNDLKAKIEKLQNVEKHLLESQACVENFKKDSEELREEIASLRLDAERVKELEQRLRESNTNYRRVRLDLEKLQNEKQPIYDTKLGRRAVELEKQLQESRINNKMYISELECLKNEISSKEMVEDENKLLKDQIKALAKNLESTEDENKNLKNDINMLTQMKDKLLQETDDLKKEIDRLQNEIQLLGGGEDNTENHHQDQKESQTDPSELRIEAGRGDLDERRARQLEETLLKYHDNNELLKAKISQLELEKNNMEIELNSLVDIKIREKQRVEEHARIKNLEKDLEEYQKTNASLKRSIIHLKNNHKKRVEIIEGRVQKCQADSENLKQVTLQLEAEIEALKKDLTTFKQRETIQVEDNSATRIVRKMKTVRSPLSLSENVSFQELENDLKLQKQKWKDAVAKLTKQYEEDINLLKKQNAVPMVQPWMMGPGQSPLIQTMPVMWQPPMVTYGNYAPPPIFEQKVETPEGGLQQLSDLVNKIQDTLDKNKQVLETETGKTQDVVAETSEEVIVLKLEGSAASTKSDESFPADNIGVNVAELNKNLLKHEETKAKIDKLQNDIQTTMKDLKEVSQRHQVLLTGSVSSDKKSGTPETSRVNKDVKAFKTVTSKCAESLKQDSKTVSASKKPETKTSSRTASSTSKHSNIRSGIQTPKSRQKK